MGKGKQVTQGDAIRRSGMPLEVVVTRLLPKLGMLPKGRFFYEVGTETYETDVWALGGPTIGPNSIEHGWFIECKQREEDKHWCFFPQADNVRDLSKNAFAIDFLEARDGVVPAKLAGLERAFFPSNLPVVGDGTQLFQKNGNWNSDAHAIQNAVRQAIMPMIQQFRWPFHRNFVLDYEGQVVGFNLAIVVTTAKIHVLREDADWQKLSSFNDLNDCFDQHPAVTSAFTTPSYVERYWLETASQFLREYESKYPDTFEKPFFVNLGKSHRDVIDHLVRKVTTSMPTRVLIAELDALESVLSAYKNELETAARS